MLILLILALSNPCAQAERVSGVAERQCYARLAERTDREMAAQWRAALKATRQEDADAKRERANRPSMAVSLLASQRAWLRYRDAQCTMISDQAAGGTGYGELDSRCRIDLNRSRAAELNRRADGFLVPRFP